jgi:hypothetical protein
MERLSLLFPWLMGEKGKLCPIRLPVVDTVFGAMSSGSAGGLRVPRGRSKSDWGTRLESRNSFGHGRFHILDKPCRIRIHLAPK